MGNPDYVGRHNPDYVFNYDPDEDAWTTDLATLDMSRPERFRDDKIWPFFERLRKEDPVHYCPDSLNGPFWSVTILAVEAVLAVAALGWLYRRRARDAASGLAPEATAGA